MSKWLACILKNGSYVKLRISRNYLYMAQPQKLSSGVCGVFTSVNFTIANVIVPDDEISAALN